MLGCHRFCPEWVGRTLRKTDGPRTSQKLGALDRQRSQSRVWPRDTPCTTTSDWLPLGMRSGSCPLSSRLRPPRKSVPEGRLSGSWRTSMRIPPLLAWGEAERRADGSPGH